MSAKKLDPTVLIALGIIATTQEACIGPCLEYAETDTDTDDGDSADSGTSRVDADPVERVLARGVLPADVVSKLKDRS